jgi:predicted tellurium resistance membrane protein TerC
MTTYSSNLAPAASPPAAAEPNPAEPKSKPMSEGQRRAILIGVVVGVVVIVAALIAAAFWLVANPSIAASVRDVFIIFMGLVFCLIGAALVILIFQLAVLTNMLQHEIKPILDSTNETVNTLRGTTTFISENLVEPIVKLNAYMAAMAQVVDSLGALGRFGRKR